MILLDWIFNELLPIFGVTPGLLEKPLVLPWLSSIFTLGDAVNTIFVVGLSFIVFHLLFVVPYRTILKICKYKGARIR